MPSPAIANPRPPIILSRTDAERLSALAMQMEQAAPLAATLLLDEIERAEIRPDDEAPDDVVRMNSTVRFLDTGRKTRRTITLVYPSQADISAGKVSVLTPVGAGLIGLAVGQEILWPDQGGHERPLRILKVTPPGR